MGHAVADAQQKCYTPPMACSDTAEISPPQNRSEFTFSGGTLDGAQWQEEVTVTEDLRYLEGHFPGAPIVPGVAQVIALAEERARHAFADLGATQGMRRLKFMSALRPGHVLRLQLTRKPGKVVFKLFRGETECSRGTLLFENA